MNKKKILFIISILIFLLLISFLFGFNFINSYITGDVVEEENYSYFTFTKAICNETNFCQDYEIVCENNEVKEMNPLTGAVVQNPEDWVDPRDEETREKLCG